MLSMLETVECFIVIYHLYTYYISYLYLYIYIYIYIYIYTCLSDLDNLMIFKMFIVRL